MKKAGIGCLCLAMAVSMAACGNTPTESTPENSSPTTNSTRYEETTVTATPTTNPTRYYDTIPDDQKDWYTEDVVRVDVDVIDPTERKPFVFAVENLMPPKKPLTEKEVRDIFLPLFHKGDSLDDDIANNFYSCNGRVEEKTSLVRNDLPYSRVIGGPYKTIEDIWNDVYTAYTEEAGKRIYSNRLDPKGPSPRFVEYKGQLYAQDCGHGDITEDLKDTVRILKQYENCVLVNMKYQCGDDTPEDSIFILCRTEDGWRLGNNRNDARYDTLEQFRHLL